VTDSSSTHQVENPPFDVSKPHTARVWNYLQGGKDNYPVDREAGDALKTLLPDIAEAARADRQLLIRVVRYLAGEVGIRQFLDIGTGLPSANNTHEVAQATAPESRIVYVDNDPLILTHARALLTSTPEGRTDYLHIDLEDPAAIIREAARTLDFTRPVALTMLGILNHIMDTDEAYTIVNRLVEALPSGSYLVISHPTTDIHGDAVMAAVKFWNEGGGTPPVTARTREEITRYFDGLELLEPGVVSSSLWRPEPSELGTPAEVIEYAGVGRKS